MAENVNSGGGKLPNAQVLKTCLTRANGLDADMAEARGELGSFLKSSQDKHNIHPKAFRLLRQCVRMDDTKLADFLRHFDHYRAIEKLDEKAGIDLFEGETGQQGEDVRPRHLKQNEADRKAAADNAAALKAGITPLHS